MTFTLHEQVLESLSDGITIQDKDFRIIYQNKAMTRSFGNQVGNRCYAIYEKRCEVCEGCGLRKAFQTGQASLVLRTAIEQDGTASYWENACIPLFDRDHNIIAGVEVCRNITDRVGLEAEVKERNVQLAQLNEQLKQQAIELSSALAKREAAEKERSLLETQLRHAQKLESIGQLAAGVAHEINTPTQFIGDNARFLHEAFEEVTALLAMYERFVEAGANGVARDKMLDEINTAATEADLEYVMAEIPKAIEQTLEGVERVSSIVRSMKEFSHPQGKEKTPADLNRAIQNTIVISRNEWKHVAEVVTDFDPALPLVSCFLDDINQVILNLILNAAHAVEEASRGGLGTITIRTRYVAPWAEIHVVDTGAGIREEIRHKIFDPFFTTKAVGKGSGQGLAISYSIVTKKHGGNISFESETDRGTHFLLRLPVSDEALASDPVTAICQPDHHEEPECQPCPH